MSVTEQDDGKIACQIDGGRCHYIQKYLADNHPDWTIQRYRETYPEAPLYSKVALRALEERRRETAAEKGLMPGPGGTLSVGRVQKAFHELFDLGSSKAALNAHGRPIMIDIETDLDDEARMFVPDIDRNYVFAIELTKSAVIAMKTGITAYFWGYHGTGKTTCFEQVAARMGRPFFRVQHTVNMEESHVLGNWTVREGETRFQLGPLPTAMINGYVYCADEYDRGTAPVLSVYQPVLEGKALVIKEAPPEIRVIKPHPNFRFVATGNTNGSGDETGLYQGTQVQDAANYSRFGLTEEVLYVEPKIEAAIVAGQGGINISDATLFVQFAGEIRKSYAAGKIGTTISTRELINAAKLGVLQSNFRSGLAKAFANRMTRADRETVEQFAQRVFG